MAEIAIVLVSNTYSVDFIIYLYQIISNFKCHIDDNKLFGTGKNYEAR